jgi:hypothetical protein
VFENKVLRRISGARRESGENCITRSFMICTPSIIRIIKSRRTRLAGYVARMGRR